MGGKSFTSIFCLFICCLSASVRSATLFGGTKLAWKSLKLPPEIHTARDRCSEALRTPLCCMSWYSDAGRSRACGSGKVGRGFPSTTRVGRVSFGGCSTGSGTGVAGVDSLGATVTRLRFNIFADDLAGVGFGGSGVWAGGASSRARALVDRRGSVMDDSRRVAGLGNGCGGRESASTKVQGCEIARSRGQARDASEAPKAAFRLRGSRGPR